MDTLARFRMNGDRIGRLGSLKAMTAILTAMSPFMSDMHHNYMMGTPWENPVVYYDPSEVPKRGGRWRACARWRMWWEREQRPANRYTRTRRP